MRCWRRRRSWGEKRLPRPIRAKIDMSLVNKGGPGFAADRTYQADVLVEGEKIAAIGPNLKGDTTLDGSDCFVMPGGIDPHTHLAMPFMGTTCTDHYESGAKAAL